VFKYQVQIGTNTLRMPPDGKIVHFDMQGPFLCVWVETTPGDHIGRCLHVIGTGWSIPEGGQHRGSVVTPEEFVWHLYEVVP